MKNMRVTAIITGMLFISSAIYAQQQERSMQKPDEVQHNLQHKNNGVVKIQPNPAAPRQMAPLGSQPVHAKPGVTTTTTRGNSQERKMEPLNGDKVVQKKN